MPADFLPLPSRKSIRLVQIVPRHPSDAYESPLHLRSRVVELSSSRLRRGESKTPPARPSISFDAYLTQPLLPERFRVLDDKGLRQKLKDKFRKDPQPQQQQQQQQPSQGLPAHDDVPDDLILGGPGIKGIAADLSAVLLADGLLDKRSVGILASDAPLAKGRPMRPVTAAPAAEPAFRNRYSWGSAHGPISGNYVALSYHSGSTAPAATVSIDGSPRNIPANLAAALRRFRDMDIFRSGLWLWIDALCINRTDAAEVAVQLALAPAVFRQAGNVVIWLGEPAQPDPVARAMAYIQDISRHNRREYLVAYDADPATSAGHRRRARLQLHAAKALWQTQHTAYMATHVDATLTTAASLFTLYGNAYWRRSWALHELAAAPPAAPVFCGAHVTQWRHVRDSAELLAPFEAFLGDLLQRVLAQHDVRLDGVFSIRHLTDVARLATRLYETRLAGADAGDVPVGEVDVGTELLPVGNPVVRQTLLLAARTECADACDRVFSLLPIPGLTAMAADTALPASQLFCDFSERCLSEDTSLTLLSLLDGRHAGAASLPSWCPDFARPAAARAQPLAGAWTANGVDDAQLLMPWAATYFEREGAHTVFRAMAWDVDAVDGLGAVSPVDAQNGDMDGGVDGGVVQPDGWARVVRDEAACALWRVMTASAGMPTAADLQDILYGLTDDIPSSASPEYPRWMFLHASADLRIKSNPLSTLLCPSPSPVTATPAAIHARHVVTTRLRHRRLAVTARGRLALVPAATQKGDMVAVLVAHGTPLIVRPRRREAGDLWCEIIGEAFIDDDVMTGKLGRLLLKKDKWYANLVYLHCM